MAWLSRAQKARGDRKSSLEVDDMASESVWVTSVFMLERTPYLVPAHGNVLFGQVSLTRLRGGDG